MHGFANYIDQKKNLIFFINLSLLQTFDILDSWFHQIELDIHFPNDKRWKGHEQQHWQRLLTEPSELVYSRQVISWIRKILPPIESPLFFYFLLAILFVLLGNLWIDASHLYFLIQVLFDPRFLCGNSLIRLFLIIWRRI